MSGERRYFGTDGVRGVVGDDLTPELVQRLGRAFALWRGGGSVLVGRDTRASGPALEEALAGGLAEGGADVRLGGVLPTPAVALLAEDGGAVVSASHNPPEFNGVKLFQRGWKLSDAEEAEIEALLDAPPAARPGTVTAVDGLTDAYVIEVARRFGAPLGGLFLAVDCANGAMSRAAPAVLHWLGAEVTAVADEPDGSNINEGCGATDLSLLRETVGAGSYDFGVAFDGDGDRLLAVDGHGNEVDGDRILAVLALHFGVDLVAVTSMTNLGFHRLMKDRGIRVLTTDVGDRYVLEALREAGGILGGEQSGHILWLDGHTSGDGLVAAVLLARAVAETGSTLAELAAAMHPLPQAKASVGVRAQKLPETVVTEIDYLREKLAARGRILVRPSGTEPVIRVLVEADDAGEAADVCASIVHLIGRELG